MNTKTEIANYALSYIGEGKISDIDDTGSKAARICKQFMQSTIDEVLRAARWNCATKRASLALLSTAPNHGYTHAYQLPVDFIRLLEVNGEQYEAGMPYLEIEAGQRLLSNFERCDIRYIAEITVAEFDPMLAEAVATKLATKAIIPLSGNADLQARIYQLHDRAIKAAGLVDAIETGSNGKNNPMRGMIERSNLINSRFRGGRFSRLRYLHPPL